MKILYGVVGEGMGHAMRARLVLEHLVREGHDVEIMASGRAREFLGKRFEGVNQIHGFHMIYEENRVRLGKTLWSNVTTGAAGVPENIGAYFDRSSRTSSPRRSSATSSRGQQAKLKYTNGLQRVNIIALAVNAVFIVLHLLQTIFFYDGLAQDVSIWSSQGSVVLMLVMILLMENQRRGLFFGKKVGFLKETARVARKYQGYIFAWAVIYTFWYHPMEATMGHLLGFIYTFFLMVQGSLMFTRAHLNKWWTWVLEISVLVHGTLVALQTNTMWPMFIFGFAGIFVVTQMYGLGLSKYWRWGFIAAYIAGVLIVYSGRGWENVNEIVRIPVIEYLLVFVLALIIWLGMRLVGLFTGRTKERIGSRRAATSGD